MAKKFCCQAASCSTLRPPAQRVLENPGGVGIRQLRLTRKGAANLINPAAVAFDDQLKGAKITAVLEPDFAAGSDLQEHGISYAARDHARSMTPASPSSVPKARRRPSALQASAVTGAAPGFLAKISAPSSMRTSKTMPSP